MATKSNDIKSKLQAQGATVIDGKSANIVADNIEAFKALLCSPELRNRVAELFPCAFADGELQMDALLQSMGQYADNVEDHESYPISWRGKAEAEKRAQTMTTATLRPCIEESVGKDGRDGVFDSQNLYIEGDNLEVLKVLERSYAGQIKMIYIDPPYNTGKEDELIYKDKTFNGIDNYKKYTMQIDDKGNNKSTKKETVGAYHSTWLSLIYPRLFVAQKLIHEDGIIAISINYIEVHNLCKLCEYLFPQKQVFAVTVQTSGGKPNGAFNISNEYIVFVVSRNFYPIPQEEDKKKYSSPYHGMNLANFNQMQRPNQVYPIFVDKEGCIVGCGKSLQERIKDGTFKGSAGDFIYNYNEASDGLYAVWPITDKNEQCVWRLISNRLLDDWRKGYIKVVENKNPTKNKFGIQYLSEGIIEKIESGELETHRITNNPRIPTLEINEYKTAGAYFPSIWLDKKFHTTKGSDDINKIIGRVFSYPKPMSLIYYLLSRTTHGDEIILDFFAGSSTTAHAVMQLNADDNGQRKYIMIQIPEPCNPKNGTGKAALEAGFKNIAEIGKERIRRAGRAIKKDHPEAIDIGFKVFKLDSSNLKKWDDKPAEDAKEVSNRLLGAQDMMVPGRSHLDVVYEYMLKYGLTLDWEVECVKVHNKDVYIVAGGMFMVCLDHDLDKKWADELVKLKKKLDPADWRVLVADESFGNETNARDNNAQNIFHTLCDAGLAPVNFIIA